MAKPNQPPPGSGDRPFLSSDFSRDVLPIRNHPAKFY